MPGYLSEVPLDATLLIKRETKGNGSVVKRSMEEPSLAIKITTRVTTVCELNVLLTGCGISIYLSDNRSTGDTAPTEALLAENLCICIS